MKRDNSKNRRYTKEEREKFIVLRKKLDAIFEENEED